MLFSEPVELATVTASTDGTVQAQVTIPGDAQPGVHRLEIQGVATDGAVQVVSAAFIVTAPAPPVSNAAPTSAGDGTTSDAAPGGIANTATLPKTGWGLTWLFVWGVLLIGFGCSAMALAAPPERPAGPRR